VGSEVQALRSKLSEHEPAAAPGRVSTKILTREVEFYQLVLGLTRVPGPRILVRVTEGRWPGGVLAPTAQASDLSGIVGEVWAAGAEAVAVNGHRIPAATEFSVDAEGITAGVFRLRPPSEIQAIRNTDGCGTLTAFAAASWTDCSRWA